MNLAFNLAFEMVAKEWVINNTLLVIYSKCLYLGFKVS